MRSRIKLIYHSNGNLERVLTGDDNIFQGAVGTTEYSLEMAMDNQSGILPTDSVFLYLKRPDGQESNPRMAYGEGRWVYTSNGWETDVDIERFPAALEISIIARRYSTVEPDRLVATKTSELVSLYIQPAGSYTPLEISSEDEDLIFEQLADLESQVDRLNTVVPTAYNDVRVTGSNTFQLRNINGVWTSDIYLPGVGGGEVTYTEMARFSGVINAGLVGEGGGWIQKPETGQPTHYECVITSGTHGQMRDEATYRDLSVDFSWERADAAEGFLADYAVDNPSGDILITCSQPIELNVKIWNGRGIRGLQGEGASIDTEVTVTYEAENYTPHDIMLSGTLAGIDDKMGLIDIKDAQQDGQITVLQGDLDGIRQELAEKEHFRGYYATTSEIESLNNPEQGDYAYNAETGTKWAYNGTVWEDTGVAVPDQVVPKSTTVPLMDGEASVGAENAYAAGDHRHPHDTTKADITYVDEQIASITGTLVNIAFTSDSWEVVNDSAGYLRKQITVPTGKRIIQILNEDNEPRGTSRGYFIYDNYGFNGVAIIG